MKTYYITSEVKSVTGWQQWRVEAESEEEALSLFQQGDVEFIDEEIEVTDIEGENVDIEVVEEEIVFETSAENSEELPIDKHVKAVTEMMLERSRVGLNKYGVNLERTDLDTLDWLTHLQQELMDGANYIEVLKERERSK